MTEAAIESASSKSSPAAGSGTSITKITLMAASGSSVFAQPVQKRRAPASVPAASAAVLIERLLEEVKQQLRSWTLIARVP